MSERIRYNDPYIKTYEHYGTILRDTWYDYILWENDQKWEYLEDFIRAAKANSWSYEIIEYPNV